MEKNIIEYSSSQNFKEPKEEVFYHSYNDDYIDECESIELMQFNLKYKLKHCMVMSIKEPFTGHVFFITLFRHSGESFIEKDTLIFKYFVKHVIQLWRFSIEDILEISKSSDMQYSALVGLDGYVFSIGRNLCEVIYSKWPMWNGQYLPDELVAKLNVLPNYIRIGKNEITISKKKFESICVELNGNTKFQNISVNAVRVAYLFADGYSFRQIAQLVDLSPATVRAYLQKVYLELGVNNKIQLSKALEKNINNS